MSDRIHQITSAILRDESPDGLVLAIREALEAERADGRREGYGNCLRDGYEARALAEHSGELDQFAPPLNADGHHPEGDYDLWHLAVYLAAGRERDFVKLLNGEGVEVYRMWPLRDQAQAQAAMDECEASLSTGKDGGDE